MKEDKVISVEVKYYKKHVTSNTPIPDKESTRLSVYFDFFRDNHHIQFGNNTNRVEIAGLLHELAELILKGKEEK